MNRWERFTLLLAVATILRYTTPATSTVLNTGVTFVFWLFMCGLAGVTLGRKP